MSSTCPQSIVNVRPLTAEIGLGVWGTPANFNRFHVLASLCIQMLRSPILAALLHGTLQRGIFTRLGGNPIIHLAKTCFFCTSLTLSDLESQF